MKDIDPLFAFLKNHVEKQSLKSSGSNGYFSGRMLVQFYRYLITVYLQLKSLWKPYGYFGSYTSWEQALAETGSYDDASIFNRVLEASRKVRDGKAEFERDGLAFSEAFEWDALPYFQKAANGKTNLRVLDFGGALGSHYYPTSRALPGIEFNWTIVEQSGFVKLGKEEFESDNLHFEENLEKALEKEYDLIVLGCVLPYLPDPYEVLNHLLKANAGYMLIDKHPVINAAKDRLTVQRIPPSIYEASYPAWFFSEAKFLASMEGHNLVDLYNCPDIFNINSQFKTYFYQLK